MSFRLLALFSSITLGSLASAELVMDQLPRERSDFDNAFVSQDFEPIYDAYDITLIDDFTVNASQLLITNVSAHMAGWDGFSNEHWTDPNIIRGFRVSIFASVSDAGNYIPAASVDLTLAEATISIGFGSPYFDRIVSLPVNLVLPAAGTYWVGIQGLMDITGNGYVGVTNSLWAGNTSGGVNALQANPGEGFGQGKSFTVSPPTDAAYSVEAVPEPATMLALGAGAAALIARRRRKNA